MAGERAPSARSGECAATPNLFRKPDQPRKKIVHADRDYCQRDMTIKKRRKTSLTGENQTPPKQISCTLVLTSHDNLRAININNEVHCFLRKTDHETSLP